MMKKLLLAALLFASGTAHAQLYSKFGPVTGVLKGNVSTPQTSAAASTDIIGLWSGCTGANFLRGDGTCATPAGTGVTSVGLTAPSWYTVTGSPVTSSGTLAITAATGQAANRVIASPDGTTGAVSLRALVAGDIPPINLGSTANGGVSSATILLGTNGGTSNGFFSVTGPATALRTFTFPNASATVLTSNAAVTVPQGGTGVVTLTNHGVLLGQGTSNVSAVSAMGLDTLLQGQGASSDPAAVSINNCGSSTQALSYSTSTHTFGCQTISAGGTGTVTNVATGTGLTGGPITTTGTVSIDQTSSLTWTGNEVFTTQTFISGAGTSLNPLSFCANGLTTTNRCWTWRVGSGADLLLDLANDAGTPGSTVLDITRAANVVSGITIGNATDLPLVSVLGAATITATGATNAPLTLDQTGAFATYIQFKNGGTARGYVGVEPSTGSLCTGDAAGDLCIRAAAGSALRASVDNGVSSTPLVANLSWTAAYVGNGGVSLGSVVAVSGYIACTDIPGSAVGASSATTFSVGTLPAAARPVHPQTVQLPPTAEDNSVIAGFTFTAVVNTNGTITFLKNNSSSGWTNAGQKGITTDTTLCYFLN